MKRVLGQILEAMLPEMCNKWREEQPLDQPFEICPWWPGWWLNDSLWRVPGAAPKKVCFCVMVKMRKGDRSSFLLYGIHRSLIAHEKKSAVGRPFW